MNGLNGNQNDYPENALVPYPVILAASKGDPDAMKIVLQHFSGYIASLCKEYSCKGRIWFKENVSCKNIRCEVILDKDATGWKRLKYNQDSSRSSLPGISDGG